MPTSGGTIAVVTRSGLDEAFHEGAIAAVDPSGSIIAGFGDVTTPFYVRSSAKPFQAQVAVDHGADLPPEHLAVACSSHDGTPTHVAIVRAILAAGGLDESHLRCPPGRPLSATADRLLAATGDSERRRLLHNCSGKHAAFLRACVAQGWDLDSYLDPVHPLQQAITRHVEDVGMLVTPEVGVDGCGAPVYRVSAISLARAFTRLDADRYARVRAAMHRYPALVSGSGNADAVIAVALDAVAKRGAEGLLAVAVAGRGALVVRCWDGAERAVSVAARAAMQQLGWMNERTPFIDRLSQPVRGGEAIVGSVRAVFQLESA